MPKVVTRRPTDVAASNVRAEMARSWPRVTQRDIGEALGIAHSAVSHRLTGRTPFDINELAVIAGLLGVDLSVLVDGVSSDSSDPSPPAAAAV
jgi:hypothetical protein